MDLQLNNLQGKIEDAEKELANFQQEEQKKIEEFMLKSGLTVYITDVNTKIARMQGKIEALKSLLPVEKEDEVKKISEVPSVIEVK